MKKKIGILSESESVKVWQKEYDDLVMWLYDNHRETINEYLARKHKLKTPWDDDRLKRVLRLISDDILDVFSDLDK